MAEVGKKIVIDCNGTRTIPLEKLKHFQGNLKELKKDMYEKIKLSIIKNGIKIPLFTWNDYIIDGHQRVYVLNKLKEDGYEIGPLPIVEINAKTKKEAAKILLLINSIYAKMTDDGLYEYMNGFELKIKDIEEIDIPEINLNKFEHNFLTDETINDDEVPENVKKITKKGDLWVLGKHRILCGDSSKIEDIKTLMNTELADIVFTDPPYGVSIGAKNRALNKIQKCGRNLRDIKDDSLSADDLYKVLLSAFKNAKSVMAECCSIFVCAPQGGSLGMMMMMMKDAGLETKHMLIWKKNQATFSMGRLDYEYQHEPILLTWNKKHKFYGKGQFKTSVWEVDKPTKSKDHPTMKPIALVENALLNNSKENDLCLDIYSGSGTTLIACEKNDRKCYGMEIDTHYCDIIVQRYAKWCSENGKKADIKLNGKQVKV